MTGLLAGMLVAFAALAYVLEPLAGGRGRSSGSDESAETLVRRMRAKLAVKCGNCGSTAEPGAAFCVSCGRVLVQR